MATTTTIEDDMAAPSIEQVMEQWNPHAVRHRLAAYRKAAEDRPLRREDSGMTATRRDPEPVVTFDAHALRWLRTCYEKASAMALVGVPEDVAAGWLLRHSGASLETAERIARRAYATYAARVGVR
jgi:hypothetical protein